MLEAGNSALGLCHVTQALVPRAALLRQRRKDAHIRAHGLEVLVLGGQVLQDVYKRQIWSRFMASQMADCQQDTVSVTVSAADYRFKASGYTVTFDGFTALYEEATDEKEKKETALPPLEQGQVLKLRELKSEQKFTQPPARYTEATLIKALEENGIGRPSTYCLLYTSSARPT